MVVVLIRSITIMDNISVTKNEYYIYNDTVYMLIAREARVSMLDGYTKVLEVKIDSIPLFVDENIEYEIIGRYHESLGTLQFKKIDCTNYTVSIKQVSKYTI